MLCNIWKWQKRDLSPEAWCSHTVSPCNVTYITSTCIWVKRIKQSPMWSIYLYSWTLSWIIFCQSKEKLRIYWHLPRLGSSIADKGMSFDFSNFSRSCHKFGTKSIFYSYMQDSYDKITNCYWQEIQDKFYFFRRTLYVLQIDSCVRLRRLI